MMMELQPARDPHVMIPSKQVVVSLDLWATLHYIFELWNKVEALAVDTLVDIGDNIFRGIPRGICYLGSHLCLRN